ncbi:hypothetical protein [Micromonospora thermarum]|uniref:Uncharacterized protein n=1 Tax=Micromonospora thermarum TaxID=2720024 RepID=A0ABX0ZCQ6_9ACTN|nr:hypothetical protein [Micromonospora thermarum]NJP35695.1 hypothetical protein [Micromonospora thermarum]
MSSPDANLLGSFVMFFDHGLLVIEDAESGAAHEDWDAASEYVHFDQDSLYVAVQSVVDGAVAVTAYRDSAPSHETEGLVEAFSGEFDSEFGRFRIHDSDNRAVLTITGRRGRNRVTVLVDEFNWAARVVVTIGVPA